MFSWSKGWLDVKSFEKLEFWLWYNAYITYNGITNNTHLYLVHLHEKNSFSWLPLQFGRSCGSFWPMCCSWTWVSPRPGCLIAGMRSFRALFPCCGDCGSLFPHLELSGMLRQHMENSYPREVPGPIVGFESARNRLILYQITEIEGLLVMAA